MIQNGKPRDTKFSNRDGSHTKPPAIPSTLSGKQQKGIKKESLEKRSAVYESSG